MCLHAPHPPARAPERPRGAEPGGALHSGGLPPPGHTQSRWRLPLPGAALRGQGGAHTPLGCATGPSSPPRRAPGRGMPPPPLNMRQAPRLHPPIAIELTVNETAAGPGQPGQTPIEGAKRAGGGLAKPSGAAGHGSPLPADRPPGQLPWTSARRLALMQQSPPPPIPSQAKHRRCDTGGGGGHGGGAVHFGH